jgi:hypothetical protein
MKWQKYHIKRPSLVIVLFYNTLGGIFSYSQLGYELIPKFRNERSGYGLSVHRQVKSIPLLKS